MKSCAATTKDTRLSLPLSVMGFDVHTQRIVGSIIWRHARARFCHQGTTKLTARHLRTRTLRTPLPPPLSRPYSVQPSMMAVPIAKCGRSRANMFAAAINSPKVLHVLCTALDHQLDASPDLLDIFVGENLPTQSHVPRGPGTSVSFVTSRALVPCRIQFSPPPQHQIVIVYLYI